VSCGKNGGPLHAYNVASPRRLIPCLYKVLPSSNEFNADGIKVWDSEELGGVDFETQP